MTGARILRATPRELAALLAEGHPIDPAALDDSQYRGTSLGLPGWIERLSWKTFRKTFHRDPTTGALRGWNVAMRQDVPGVPRERGGAPLTFGHYRVRPATGQRAPRPCGPGLLLDYGRVRDPIVALRAGSVELLLGWSFVDLGVVQLATPSYFLLEREGALEHVVPG